MENTQKVYYRIAEVSSVINEQTTVVRHWLLSHPELEPKKRVGGKRFFTEDELDRLKVFAHLVRVEMYTLQGAINKLSKFHKLNTHD